jgi:uncharacterized protein with HEPN domain
MMNRRDDTVYLRHILDATHKIATYLQGKDEQTFRQESLLQDGVIRQLGIIGEAVKRPDSYPQSYESIDEEVKGPKLLRRRASVWYV